MIVAFYVVAALYIEGDGVVFNAADLLFVDVDAHGMICWVCDRVLYSCEDVEGFVVVSLFVGGDGYVFCAVVCVAFVDVDFAVVAFEAVVARARSCCASSLVVAQSVGYGCALCGQGVVPVDFVVACDIECDAGSFFVLSKDGADLLFVDVDAHGMICWVCDRVLYSCEDVEGFVVVSLFVGGDGYVFCAVVCVAFVDVDFAVVAFEAVVARARSCCASSLVVARSVGYGCALCGQGVGPVDFVVACDSECDACSCFVLSEDGAYICSVDFDAQGVVDAVCGADGVCDRVLYSCEYV